MLVLLMRTMKENKEEGTRNGKEPMMRTPSWRGAKNRPRYIEYDEIAKILGRNANQCYVKYMEITKKNKRIQVMTYEGLSHIKNSTSGQLIPEELDIKNLLSDDRVFKSFDEALSNSKYGYHITQIPIQNGSPQQGRLC